MVPIGTGRADRLLYQPLLGLAVLGVAGASRVRVGLPSQKWAIAAVALLVLRFGAVSAHRVPDWHDDIRIWTSAVRVEPASVKARMNLSMHILRAETPESAREVLDLIAPVLSSGSSYGPLLEAEGKARMFLGDNDRARELLRESLQHGADSAKVLIELGNIALSTGDGAEALACFRSVERLGYEPAHAGIGRASALSVLRRYDESASAWQPIAAAMPDSVPIRLAYAWNLRASSHPMEAASVLRAGIARHDDPRLWNELARTLMGIDGKTAEAVDAASEAVRREPSQINLTTLVRAQIAAGRTADALLSRERIVDADSLRAIDRIIRSRR